MWRLIGMSRKFRVVVAGTVALGVLVFVILLLDNGPAPVFASHLRGASLVQDPSGVFRPTKPGSLQATEVESTKVAKDGRLVSLRILGGNPGCWSVGRLQVDYAPDRILLRVYGGYHNLPANTDCTGEGRFYTLLIRLDESVDGRLIESVELLSKPS